MYAILNAFAKATTIFSKKKEFPSQMNLYAGIKKNLKNKFTKCIYVSSIQTNKCFRKLKGKKKLTVAATKSKWRRHKTRILATSPRHFQMHCTASAMRSIIYVTNIYRDL